MRRLEQVLSGLSRLLVYLATIAGLLLTGFVILAALMRYFVSAPFHFTEELVGLLFIAMVFLTVPHGTAQRQHIAVTLFISSLGARARWIIDIFSLLVMIAFTSWFTVEAYRFTAFAYEIGALTEQSDLVLTPWMAVMPFSFAIVTLIVVIHLGLRIIGGPSAESSDPAGHHG